MAATWKVLGEWKPPVLPGRDPDMEVINEAQELLQYKTKITILEWWTLFPVRRWWAYALKATKTWGKATAPYNRPSYAYFLKCLKTAATGGAKFEEAFQGLKRFWARLGVGRPTRGPVVCPVHGQGCLCEHSFAAMSEAHEAAVREQFLQEAAGAISRGWPVLAPAGAPA